MQIEGLSLLLDLKTSIKKQRLYRHIINQVQRKIEKDDTFPHGSHLMEILLQEIQAVHGLLEEVILGQFDKNTEKISKLLKIMNRNIGICMQLFQAHMARELAYINISYGRHHKVNEKSYLQIRNNLQQFFILVLNSSYYIHLLGLLSGSAIPQFQMYTRQCKTILNELISYPVTKLQSKIVVSRIFLLLMAISIKNENYGQAKFEFYESIFHIMSALVTNQTKTNKRSRISKGERNIVLLLMMGLMNNQRMLILSDNFVGWDIGFGLLKGIDKCLRVQHSSWGKYVRNQYDSNGMMCPKKLEEVRNVYLPYVVEHSEAYKMVLTAEKLRKSNFLYLQPVAQPVACSVQTSPSPSPQIIRRRHATPKKTYYSTGKNVGSEREGPDDQSSGYVITYNQLLNHNQSRLKRNLNSNSSSNSSTFYSKELASRTNRSGGRKNVGHDWGTERGFTDRNRNRGRSKQGGGLQVKYPSIDWFEESKSNAATILNTIFSSNMQNDQQSRKQTLPLTKNLTNASHLLKASKKLKRSSLLQAKNLLNQQNYQLCKHITKERSKEPIMHKLITEEEYPSMYEGFSRFMSAEVGEGKQRVRAEVGDDRERKSVEVCLVDTFMRLVVRNKRKLRVCLLADKYELAKKRKKARNYQLQMLEFELQKSIGNLLIPVARTSSRKKQTILSRNNHNSNICLSLLNTENRRSLHHQEQAKKQKALEDSHKKSKEVMRQMLKKITGNRMILGTRGKNSPNRSKDSTDLFLSYRQCS